LHIKCFFRLNKMSLMEVPVLEMALNIEGFRTEVQKLKS